MPNWDTMVIQNGSRVLIEQSIDRLNLWNQPTHYKCSLEYNSPDNSVGDLSNNVESPKFF